MTACAVVPEFAGPEHRVAPFVFGVISEQEISNKLSGNSAHAVSSIVREIDENILAPIVFAQSAEELNQMIRPLLGRYMGLIGAVVGVVENTAAFPVTQELVRVAFERMGEVFQNSRDQLGNEATREIQFAISNLRRSHTLLVRMSCQFREKGSRESLALVVEQCNCTIHSAFYIDCIRSAVTRRHTMRSEVQESLVVRLREASLQAYACCRQAYSNVSDERQLEITSRIELDDEDRAMAMESRPILEGRETA